MKANKFIVVGRNAYGNTTDFAKVHQKTGITLKEYKELGFVGQHPKPEKKIKDLKFEDFHDVKKVEVNIVTPKKPKQKKAE